MTAAAGSSVRRVIDERTIEEAGRLLAEAANGPAKVLLFGSHASGEPGPDSDLDFLVIEREVGSRHDEMVRLARVLRPLGVPVDVLVVDERHAEEWATVRGSVIHDALTKGRVLHDRA